MYVISLCFVLFFSVSQPPSIHPHWCPILSLCFLRERERERERGRDFCICKRRFIMRSWIMWLWRLTSPTVFHLWAEDPGKLVMKFTLNLKAWEPGGADGVNPKLSTEEDEVRCPSSGSEAGKKGQISQIPPSSLFCPIQALNGLNDAPAAPATLERAVYLSESLTQVLILSGSTLTDTPRNKVLICALSPVKRTHEINHCIYPPPTCYYYYFFLLQLVVLPDIPSLKSENWQLVTWCFSFYVRNIFSMSSSSLPLPPALVQVFLGCVSLPFSAGMVLSLIPCCKCFHFPIIPPQSPEKSIHLKCEPDHITHLCLSISLSPAM